MDKNDQSKRMVDSTESSALLLTSRDVTAMETLMESPFNDLTMKEISHNESLGGMESNMSSGDP